MNEAIAARESASYRAARNRLLEEEIALRRMTEAVADHRRRLPPGAPVPEDYILRRAGSGARVRFSELFGDGDALLVYCYMYPRHRQDTREGAAAGETAALPRGEQPCPRAPRCSISSTPRRSHSRRPAAASSSLPTRLRITWQGPPATAAGATWNCCRPRARA